MAGEIFYPPPTPTQPAPHVPIPAQGQQPPRWSAVGMMTAVLASWPTGLEYQAPQRPVTVPIPAQGQQPPRTTVVRMMTAVLASHPTGLEYEPHQRPRRPTPPSATDQPPPYAGILSDMLECVRAWDPPDPQPVQRPLTVAPLTLTYGQQPPRVSAALAVVQYLAGWPTGFEYQPYQKERRPPIPTAGDQPPRQRTAPPYSLWLADPPTPQPTEQTAAVVPTPVAAQPPFARPPDSVLAAWQPDPSAARRSPTVPIPAQGDQPPRYSVAPLAALVAAWTPPDPAPWQKPLTVAPLALIYGDQPPRTSGVNLGTIRDAWNPPAPPPTQRPTTAPVPRQGDQPPRASGVNQAVIRRAWDPADPQVFVPAAVVQPAAATTTFPVVTGTNTNTLDPAGTSLTVTAPGGAGSFLVAALQVNGVQAVSTPTGWTFILAQADSFAGSKLWTYYRLGDGSATDDFTVSLTSTIAVAGVTRISGQATVNPVNANAGLANASGTSPPSADITTTAANCLILRYLGDDRGVASGLTITAPTGTSEDYNVRGATSVGAGLDAAEENQAGAGATTSRTFTLSSARDSAAITIGIAPGATVADVPAGPSRATAAVVQRAWEAEAFPRQRPAAVPVPAQGDQPPRASAANLGVILSAWEPAPATTQRARPGRVVSVDAPPPRPAPPGAILDSWVPADPVAQRPARLVPIPEAVAAAPPAVPYPLVTVLAWYADEARAFWVAARLVQPGAAPPVYVPGTWPRFDVPARDLALVAPGRTLRHGATAHALAADVPGRDLYHEAPPRKLSLPIPRDGVRPP